MDLPHRRKRRGTGRDSSKASTARQPPPTPQELALDQVIQGECVEVLSTLPDASVDLVFADPPYNLQLHQELLRPDQSKVEGVEDGWDRFESFAAYDAFTRAWLSQCRRVLKADGTLWVIGSYHNIFRIGTAVQDLGFWILNDVCWIKTNPMPNFRGVRLTNAHETLIWAQRTKGARYTFHHHILRGLNEELQMRSDWELPLCTGGERLKVDGRKAHSTQKPEALLARVLLASTDPGDVVLDPFFGTGTTGAVARRLHRHFIGIEREPSYVALARQRIAAVQRPLVPPTSLELRGPRDEARVPFGVLVEAGWVRPGQRLTLLPGGKVQAEVLVSGRLRSGSTEGSIHQVAGELRGVPTNGWAHWEVEDPTTGQPVVLDVLRRRWREQARSPPADAEEPE